MPIFNVDKGVQQVQPARPVTPIKPLDLGSVLGSVASGASDIIQETDNNNQQYIKDSLRDAYNIDNKIFGVDAAATLESPIETAKREGNNTPEAMQKAQKDLETMKLAVGQGKLRESNYQGRMSAVMRELRARFPGYDDQIDQIATKIVGDNPDHAVRKALMHEATQDQSKRDAAAKEWDGFVEKNMDHVTATGIDPKAAWEMARSDPNRFRMIAYSARQKNTQLEQANAALANAEKQDKFLQTRAENALGDWHSNALANVFDAELGRQGFKSLDQFNDFLVDLSKRGTPPSVEEQQKINTVVTMIQSNLDKAWFAKLNEKDATTGRTYGSLISQDKLDSIRKKTVAPLEELKSGVIKGDFGVLTSFGTMLKNQQDNVTFSIFNQSPENKYLFGIAQSLGPSVFNLFINSHPELLKGLTNPERGVIGQIVGHQVTKGSIPLKDSLSDMRREMETTGAVTSKATGRAIKTITDMIQDPAVASKDPDALRNLGEAVFGNKNMDMIDHIVRNGLMDQKSLDQTMKLLTSEGVSNALFNNRIKDPTSWKNYASWTVANSTAKFSHDADTLKYLRGDGNSNINVVQGVDGFFHLTLSPIREKTTSDVVSDFLGLPDRDSVALREYQQHVDRVNDGMRAVQDVYKKMGLNPAEGILRVSKELGLDGINSKDKEIPWVHRVLGAMQENATKSMEQMSTKSGGPSNMGSKPKGGDGGGDDSTSGGDAPDGPVINRDSFRKELNDPHVRAKLYAMTNAEVGSQGEDARQAFIETTLNRAAARGKSISDTLSGSYFPASTYNNANRVYGNPELHRDLDPVLERVLGGSNLSNFATGNASGTVGFAGGPHTFSAGGERFGIEGPDIAWARANGASPEQIQAMVSKNPVGAYKSYLPPSYLEDSGRALMRSRDPSNPDYSVGPLGSRWMDEGRASDNVEIAPQESFWRTLDPKDQEKMINEMFGNPELLSILTKKLKEIDSEQEKTAPKPRKTRTRVTK